MLPGLSWIKARTLVALGLGSDWAGLALYEVPKGIPGYRSSTSDGSEESGKQLLGRMVS